MLFFGCFSNITTLFQLLTRWRSGALWNHPSVESFVPQDDDLKELSELMEMGKNKRVPRGR